MSNGSAVGLGAAIRYAIFSSADAVFLPIAHLSENMFNYKLKQFNFKLL